MKNSVIIEGSEFISSRRAADITGYSNDYIGQLCRGKKIEARMIGRSWFVDSESLRKYEDEIKKHVNDFRVEQKNSALNVYSRKHESLVITNEAMSPVEMPKISWKFNYYADDRPLLPDLKKTELIKPIFRESSRKSINFRQVAFAGIFLMLSLLTFNYGLVLAKNFDFIRMATKSREIVINSYNVVRDNIKIYSAATLNEIDNFDNSASVLLTSSLGDWWNLSKGWIDNIFTKLFSSDEEVEDVKLETVIDRPTFVRMVPASVVPIPPIKSVQSLNSSAVQRVIVQSNYITTTDQSLLARIIELEKNIGIRVLVDRPFLTKQTDAIFDAVGRTSSSQGNDISSLGNRVTVLEAGGGSSSVDTAVANRWTALQQFSNSSSTLASVYNALYVGTTATTTILGTATSTFGAGIQASYLNITGTLATSTFARGIDLAGGCFAINGICLGGASGSGIVNTGTTGQVAFYSSSGIAVSGTSTLMLLDEKVGIGTTSPYAKLSVVGQVVTAYFTATTTTASTFPYASTTAISVSSLTSGRVTYATTGGLLTDNAGLTFDGTKLIATYASTTAFTSSGSAYFATTGGSVGIGTTSPWAKLSINPIAGDGPSFVIGSSTATNFLVNNSGKIGVASTSPFGRFGIETQAGDIWGFAVGSSTKSLLSVSTEGFGTTTLAGLNVSATATSTSNVGFNISAGCFSINGSCISGGGAGSGTVNTGTIGQAAFYASSGTAVSGTSTLMLLDEKVGIGTTSPYAKLSVVGLVVAEYFHATSTTATSTIMGVFSVGSTTPAGSSLFSVGTSSPLLTVNKNSGNVGIGTTTPYAKLSVVGPVVAQYFHATSTTATSTLAGGLHVNSGALVSDFTTGITSISSLEAGNFNFEDDAGAVSWADLQVTSSAPANTPQSYTAYLDSNPMLLIYGESNGSGGVQNTRVGVGTSTISSRFSVWGSGTGTSQLFSLVNNASTTVMQVLDNGNVGIGTTSPYAALSVVGASGIVMSKFHATSTTATSTIAGFLDVLGTGSNSTSTYSGNLWVKGSLQTGSGSMFLTDNGLTSSDGNISLSRTSTSTFAQPVSFSSKVSMVGLSGDASTIGIPGVICLDSTNELRKLSGVATCIVSSRDYKDNINDLNHGLDWINQLRPVTFDYKANGTASLGFIAEEVDQVSPLLSVRNQSGKVYSVRYELMPAVLVKAVQEQQQQIIELGLRIDAVTSPTASTTISFESNSFINAVTNIIQKILKSTTEFIVGKISATLAVFDRVETRTVAVSNGIELKDKVTGEIWCLSISNGEWDKVKGTCLLDKEVIEEVETVVIPPPQIDIATTTPSIDIPSVKEVEGNDDNQIVDGVVEQEVFDEDETLVGSVVIEEIEKVIVPLEDLI